MVIQKILQPIIQKVAIKFTKRSAVRSFDSSALQSFMRLTVHGVKYMLDKHAATAGPCVPFAQGKAGHGSLTSSHNGP
jgi:hypothetical protein